MDTSITLNKGQEEAIRAFLSFMLSDEKEMLITGGPGFGKTHLMQYMKKFIKEHYENTCKLVNKPCTKWSFYYTATTNKAAEVLEKFLNEPAVTIHSLLGLVVKENYDTGETKLTKKGLDIVYNSIIFIDECSMINHELYEAIHKYTKNCKIVYVGDKYQLAPVKETLSPVFKNVTNVVELTEPVRNKNHKELMDICEQLKETVKTGIFKPIHVDGSVIQWKDKEDIQEEIKDKFKVFSLNKRLLCYSNKNVIGYNRYIQKTNNKHTFEEGNTYISASSLADRNFKLSVESPVVIDKIINTNTINICGIGDLNVLCVNIKNRFDQVKTVLITEEYDKFLKILKSLANAKKWKDYFFYKEQIIDIRPYEASTIHKAQGSTLDTVYIDLTDISSCTQPNMLARLLYVAFSRAREKVILFGTLKDKYGGLSI